MEIPESYPRRGAYGDSYRDPPHLPQLSYPSPPRASDNTDIWGYETRRPPPRREDDEIIIRRGEGERPRYVEDALSERSDEDEYRRVRRDPVTIRRPEILNWIGESSKLTTITRDAAVGAGEVASDLLTALARKLEGQPVSIPVPPMKGHFFPNWVARNKTFQGRLFLEDMIVHPVHFEKFPCILAETSWVSYFP